MRALLTLSRPILITAALLVLWSGLPAPALAAGDPVAPVEMGDIRRRTPNLILGGGAGFANHWGKSYQVDTVTGASTSVNSYSKRGMAMNAFADLAAVDVGRGDLGVTAGFTLTLPSAFMNFALVPRYRLHFPLKGTTLRSVEPWMGLGVAFAFREKIDKDFYLWLPLSAGCDLALGSDGLYAGVAIDINQINPKGVNRTSTYEDHMDNLVVLVRLSYRVF